MLLAIDVGNTNIVCGIFTEGRLVGDFRVHTDPRYTADELGLLVTSLLGQANVETAKISGVVVGNVVPGLTGALQRMCAQHFNCAPLLVDGSMYTGITIGYDDPRQLGADRIANVVAAAQMHSAPAIVVDCGTATKLDAVTADGNYLGGAIAPGVLISLDALVLQAARLNPVDLVAPPSVIARSTTTGMQSGLMYGYVSLVEGMIGRMHKEMGHKAQVIGTGGLLSLLAAHTSIIDIVDPHLTLHGLRIVHERNAEAATTP